MTVVENSKKAYKELKDLGIKQQLVYEQVKYMEKSGRLPSAQDVANELGWPINCVTGRVSELKRYGYLRVHGVKTSKMGTTVGTLCTADPNDEKLISLGEIPAREFMYA